VNARTELALTYNDISPLENHHCSAAFDILNNPQVNILAQLDSDTYRRVREGMIKYVVSARQCFCPSDIRWVKKLSLYWFLSRSFWKVPVKLDFARLVPALLA